MTLDDLKVWLVLGFVPYNIQKRYGPGGTRLCEIRALFWTFAVKGRPSGRHDWTLRVPLIEKLCQAVWAVVMQFKDGKMEATIDYSAEDIPE